MRLVLDTNVVASALLWSGTPTQLLDAAQSGELELFTSTRLLAELAGILTRAKFAKALAATGLPREGLPTEFNKSLPNKANHEIINYFILPFCQ